jgi:hypothetical protein
MALKAESQSHQATQNLDDSGNLAVHGLVHGVLGGEQIGDDGLGVVDHLGQRVS